MVRIHMKFILFIASMLSSVGLFSSCANNNEPKTEKKFEFSKMAEANQDIPNTNDTLEIATLGAGCFWCVEAVFQSLKGVYKVQSGYSGGNVKNPSYKEVCTGRTGHAEVVQVTFNPQVISFAQLLEVFFGTHDPTTLNRQGADEGTQYRSAIFYHSDEQKRLGELAIKAANESGNWSDPIVTEVTAFSNFYPTEDYHDNYYNLNEEQPYCRAVITPKMDKFKKKFAELLK